MAVIKIPAMAARIAACVFLVCAAGTAQRAHADRFNITGEAPGAEFTTSTFTSSGVMTFDSSFDEAAAGGPQSITWNPAGIPGMTVQIDNVTVVPADEYGGSDGIGYYATDYNGPLTVTMNQSVTYFGLWLSALNYGNFISIYNNDTLVADFDPYSMDALLASTPAYFGNTTTYYSDPNADGDNDPAEAFVFINFYDETGSFNKIVLGDDGSFESDNYTVGTYATETGNVVPEPASIALFSAALGALAVVRRRRRGG